MLFHKGKNEKTKELEVMRIEKYRIVGVAGYGFSFSELTAIIIKKGKISGVLIDNMEVKGEISELIGSFIVYEYSGETLMSKYITSS